MWINKQIEWKIMNEYTKYEGDIIIEWVNKCKCFYNYCRKKLDQMNNKYVEKKRLWKVCFGINMQM